MSFKLSDFKPYKVQEFEKAKNFFGKIDSLESAFSLPTEKLYPEFSLNSDDNVGFFDAFCCGELEKGSIESISDIGKNASILTMLPFHDKLVVRIDRVPEKHFKSFYGVEFKDFRELIDAGKILPLLPSAQTPLSLLKGDMAYLKPLYAKYYPSSERVFLILRDITIRSIGSDRASSITRFTHILLKAIRDIFQDSAQGLSFLKLGNRAIYRGQPLLILLWIHLATNTIKSLEEIFLEIELEMPNLRSGIEDITTYILDSRDRIFESTLLVPGTVNSYSKSAFDWVTREAKLLKDLRDNQVTGILHEDEYKALEKIFAFDGMASIENIALLRKYFIYEPIEAVNNISKFIHWLEHSNNVVENQKAFKALSLHLQKNKFNLKFRKKHEEIDEIASELTKEIKSVSFDMRASKIMLEVGAVIGTAIAGKYLGTALSATDMSSLFSMCGALAGSVLSGKYSHEVTKNLGKALYGNSLPFLLWKRQNP